MHCVYNLNVRRLDSAREWAGKSLHIELIDQNTDKSFAWLGVAQVKAMGE